MVVSVRVVFVGAAMTIASTAALGQYATSVVSYSPGTGTNASYRDPSRVLGEPSRFTSGGAGSAVTPFQPAFRPTQLTQVGLGGSLVVGFGTPITNAASNPFGIDFIVFGNAFFVAASGGTTTGGVAAEGGDIDVSADGVSWFRVASNAADGLYPTLGYSDLTNPTATTPGNRPSNFQLPVDPAFSVRPGMSFAEIVAGYNGSGGGFGVDIAATGLSSVSFVRISVEANAQFVPEIDGFAVVPSPGAALLLGLAPLLAARRRRTI